MAVITNIDINGMMDRVISIFFKVGRIPFDIWNRVVPPEFKTAIFVFLFIISVILFTFTARYIIQNWTELTA